MDYSSFIIWEKHLDRFLEFGRDHRGLKAHTLKHQQYSIRCLRSFLFRRQIRRVQSITLEHLDAFLLELSQRAQPTTVYGVGYDLRNFFRFLFLEGIKPSNPAEYLLPPCRYREDLRPKYRPWWQIQELLKGMNRRSSTGKRDHAILVLMAHQGLRAREVGSLRLSDIRWETNSLFLRQRKNGRSAHLPLSPITRRALKDYLATRLVVPFQEVFTTVRAPLKPLGSSVHAIAQRHLHRHFGRTDFFHGAYLLRHSFAKALLDKGAPLPVIGTLLGHKSLDSTLVYTRVHTKELQEVADNYSRFL